MELSLVLRFDRYTCADGSWLPPATHWLCAINAIFLCGCLTLQIWRAQQLTSGCIASISCWVFIWTKPETSSFSLRGWATACSWGLSSAFGKLLGRKLPRLSEHTSSIAPSSWLSVASPLMVESLLNNVSNFWWKEVVLNCVLHS